MIEILNFQTSERGAAVLVAIFLMIGVFAAGIFGAALMVIHEDLISKGIIRSAKNYYVAEGGIEDILLRLQPGRTLPSSPAVLAVGEGAATTIIGPIVAGVRTLAASGLVGGTTRRVSVDATIATESAQFFLGAQVGDGGIDMGGNTKIVGNVFSNGTIKGAGRTQSTIDGTAKVGGSNKFIETVKVTVDAYADKFKDCEVTRTLHYVTSLTNCPAGSTQRDVVPPEPQSLPITQQQIDSWKSEAVSGGTHTGNYIIGNNQSVALGPKKITGNLDMGNSSILTLTGTVWVVGEIKLGNQSVIQLDPAYGQQSGVLISDTKADIGNGAILRGTGQQGSYLMLIVTANIGAASAIAVGNDLTAAILYAPGGTIDIGNSIQVREATAYKLKLGNNSVLAYESGLMDVSFTSGPSGSWGTKNWQEIP